MTLAAIARRLAESTADDALLEITNSAVDSGADFTAIGYLEGAKVTVRVQSDPIMTTTDDLQTDLQQGPCPAHPSGGGPRGRGERFRNGGPLAGIQPWCGPAGRP